MNKRNNNGQVQMFISGRPYQPDNYEYRSKHEYPYSYSPFILFGEDTHTEDGTIYSDRLYQQDYDLTEKLCLKHFGDTSQYFCNRSPALIENFLRDRLNLPNLQLTLIVEWCNISNGFPLWSFHYKRND